VVFGLETVAVVAGRVVGGAPAVVVVVGSARGTGGPIPLERDGGFVVGTGTVGTVVVGTGTVRPGALVVGALVAVVVGTVVVGTVVVGTVVVGTAVVGGAVVGGAYLGAVVVVGVEVCASVVGTVLAVRGGLVVELVDPVGGPGTSACAVRVIEPKSRLSRAFSASRFVSRCIWTASSCLRTSIAAVSPAEEASAASRVGVFPNMAFEARSMYCLAFAGSCLAR